MYHDEKQTKGSTFGSAAVDIRAFKGLMNQCFVKGTLLKCEDGLKPIETIYPGDLILTRTEHNADAPLEFSWVEQVFIGTARLMELTVAGKVIRTTEQHPFHLKDRGLGPCQ